MVFAPPLCREVLRFDWTASASDVVGGWVGGGGDGTRATAREAVPSGRAVIEKEKNISSVYFHHI